MNHTGKRWIISLLLVLIMVLCANAALAASGTVNVNSLVLRKENSTQSDAVQTLSKGEKVDIIHMDGSWYKVKYGRYTGYVIARYIKTSDDVPTKDEVESLRVGSSGSEVKAVQKRLKELGYLTATPDGQFGKQTEEAVKAFQKRNGLTANGVVNATTRAKLDSSSAKKAATTDSSANTNEMLQYGDKGSDVKKLQERLKELGYFTGNVTDNYGAATKAAVKAFQTRNGLTADGIAGAATLKKVYASSAKKAEDAKQEDEDETLRSGSKGDAVKKLQERLKELGYFTGNVTNNYGSATTAAVKAFQTRNGLTADGVAGEATLKKVYSSSAKKAENAKQEEEDTILRYGSEGDAVKKLQERLTELGYFSVKANGNYGPTTKEAVEAFQTRNGLTADGVAGEATLKKVYSSSAKKAAADKQEEDDTLSYGSEGDAVKKLQERLKELGYFSVNANGNYGPTTKEAVKAFQTRNGLTADGVAGEATLKKVYSSSAKKAAADKQEEDDTLSYGSEGDAVKKLQERLTELGYFSVNANGNYGPTTQAAVKAFQTRNGLTADGIAGAATLKKVYSSSAKKAEKDTQVQEDEVLRYGYEGDAVKALQEKLKELGYFTGNVTNRFGSATTVAVKAFQTRNGLTADGIAGEATLKKLNSSSAKAADEDETLRSGSKGDEVKKLQQRLKALGYFNTTATGVYGTTTEAAVKAFQNRNSLTANGIANAATQKKLYASSAKAAEGADKVETTSALSYGSTGDAVKALQQRLKELGYFTGTVTNRFGSATTAAVKAFQTRNGLTADGIAGTATLKKLNSSSAKVAEGDTALRVGSKGDEVKKLQETLRGLGYFSYSVTGVYGTTTEAAVKAFQTRNSLTANGIADAATQKKLYSSSAKAAEDTDGKVSEDLRAGSYGAEVRTLQNRLKELGYYKNSIDGSYGSVTVAAVKAFQKNNDLTVNGVCNKATRNVLNSSSAKRATAEDEKEKFETLSSGDTGAAVKELQYRLKELGYYSDSRDGTYGTSTRTAVMAFQKRNGLTANGVANAATQEKLYSSSAVKAAESDNSGSTGSSGSNVTADSLKSNQTLTPGDSGDQVKAMQLRLKELGYFTGNANGNYGSATRTAVIDFQKGNGLTQDGIAGQTTLKKMVSSSAVAKNNASSSKYVTERLDWFNGGASRIPRGAIFQVKDVKTGLVFTAKRQAGGYHLDAEPLTAADTAVLLKINGGVEFSYRRRPMLVLYNGRVYACSIYSEPHGSDTIATNNFDGQFCLHFYGSKTHGTDRVDPDHASCEAQALKATW